MKTYTHTTIDIGPNVSSKKVRLSRKQCKCASAFFAVQSAFKKP